MCTKRRMLFLVDSPSSVQTDDPFFLTYPSTDYKVMRRETYDSFSPLVRLRWLIQQWFPSPNPIGESLCWFVWVTYIDWKRQRLRLNTGHVNPLVVQLVFIQTKTMSSSNQRVNIDTSQHQNMSNCEIWRTRWKIGSKTKQFLSQRFTLKNWLDLIYRQRLSHLHRQQSKQVSPPFRCIVVMFLCCVESGFNRVRRKLIPPLPKSMNFDIPDAYRQTLNNERFVCVDKTAKNKRIIIFATDQQLKMLFESEWIFLDGTFDACPSQFKQLYTIHSLKFNQSKWTTSSWSILLSFFRFSLCG